VPMHLGILGKSADFGARTYVKAAQTSLDGHVSRTDSHLTLLQVENCMNSSPTSCLGEVHPVSFYGR
jgi:hypothetical protein